MVKDFTKWVYALQLVHLPSYVIYYCIDETIFIIIFLQEADLGMLIQMVSHFTMPLSTLFLIKVWIQGFQNICFYDNGINKLNPYK
jgi:hypothetical protein